MEFIRLLGRLKVGRAEPFAHVRAGLGLAGLAQDIVPGRSRFHRVGFLMQPDGFGRKVIFKTVGLFETSPPDHGALLSVEGGSAVKGVHLTDKCQGPLGDS